MTTNILFSLYFNYLCRMNQISLYFKDALIIAGFTLLLFFGFYFIFGANASITPKLYYSISLMLISFGLIPFYGGYAFYKVLSLSKKKAKTATKEEDLMTFREGLRESFLPMFLGGTASLIIIFVFLNTGGQWAQDAFKEGYYETFVVNNDLTNINKEELENGYSEMMKNNLFSASNFFAFYPFVLSYYIVVSVFFAQFLKKRVY